MPNPKIPLSKKEVETVEALAGYGLSMEKIAHALGMSKKTLERRMKDSPKELGASDALVRGRAVAEATVAQNCFEMAKSKSEPSMTKFWLQCRAGWRGTEDKIDPKRGEENGPQVVVVLPDNGRNK